jgi:hypothetical protein
MTELEDTLNRISREFANVVVDALMQLPFETWFEDVTPVSGRRGSAEGGTREARFDAPKATKKAAAKSAKPARKPTPAVSETEVSILEHLNEAGPTGSTVRAWVISTQGELSAKEHEHFEREANEVLEALEASGRIQKKAFSRSRGQVYALAPV